MTARQYNIIIAVGMCEIIWKMLGTTADTVDPYSKKRSATACLRKARELTHDAMMILSDEDNEIRRQEAEEMDKAKGSEA